MYTLTCYCDTEIETEIEEVYDISRTPSLIDDIINGRFLLFTCPKCGKILKPEFTLRFTDESRSLNLYFIPETERNAFLAGTFTEFLQMDGASYTVVIGYPELAERMQLLKLELDPGVMEVIKYFYLRKIEPQKDVRILFHHRDGDKLYFHIHGLKEDEIGVAGIPFSFYAKIEQDLSGPALKPEYAEIISPPYLSVNKIMLDSNTGEEAEEEEE